MIKENDIVEIDLVVKDNNTKEVLDTTLEDVAKKEKLYSDKVTYIPLKVVFGSGELLPSVENNIKDLNKDQEKTFSLKKEEAFGDKDSKNIKLIPFSNFKKENIKPAPGMHINFGNTTGKVISVSGGRVQVDFNHDFAGKDLEYKIIVKNIYTTDKEKVNGLVNKFFYFIPKDKIQTNIQENNLEIVLPLGMPKETEYLKSMFCKSLFKITKYNNIKFSEIYEKSKK
jgi:FKBP-type peptidyl-prolyl cis-trans isomerase 2